MLIDKQDWLALIVFGFLAGRGWEARSRPEQLEDLRAALSFASAVWAAWAPRHLPDPSADLD